MSAEPKTILVVSPERHILRLVEVNLEREGVRVLKAYSVAEALAVLAAERVDVVLTDGEMPELAAAMQKDPAARNIPIRVMPGPR